MIYMTLYIIMFMIMSFGLIYILEKDEINKLFKKGR